MTSSVQALPGRAVPARPGSVVAVLVVFATAGFLMGQGLARVPALRDAIGADKAGLGLALMGMGMGSLLTMPFTGRLVDRFGSRVVVMTTGVLAGLGWAVASLAPSVPALLAVLVLTGCAVGVWDVAMNIQGAHVERLRGRALMPQLHAAFSGGAVLGAGAGALAAHLGIGLVQLPVLGLVAAVCSVAGASRFVPETHEAAEDDETGPAEGEGAPARRGMTRAEVLIGVLCLAGALAEGSANDWLALLLVDVHDAPAAFGAVVLMAFNLTMAVGRLAGAPVIDRVGRTAVVRGGGVLGAVGILMVTLTPSLPVALLGGLLWGLGVATIFPAAMSAAGEIPGRGNRAITVVSTIAYGAFLLGAPTIGFVAEIVGLDRALFVVVGFLVLMVALAPVMRERAPGRGASRSA